MNGEIDTRAAASNVRRTIDALWNGTASEREIIEWLQEALADLGLPGYQPHTIETALDRVRWPIEDVLLPAEVRRLLRRLTDITRFRRAK